MLKLLCFYKNKKIGIHYTKEGESVESLLYITLNVFCILVLVMVLVRIVRSSDKRISQIMYSWFIIASIILCASDLFWGVIDMTYNWSLSDSIDYVANGIYHVFTLVVCYLWYLFAESEQETRTVTTRIGLGISLIPFIFDLALVMGSSYNGLVFSISEVGEYERGNCYILHISICFFYVVLTSLKAFIRSFYKKNFLKKERYRTLASFCLVPLLAGALQVAFKGSPMISAGVTFAAIQVYMSSREQLISIDPLTKMNNRAEMMRFLDNKMRNRSANKDLYLFIMDLDGFKKINDNFGHVEGDNAIIITAEALKTVVRKTNFFICRYGGDEFVAVGEVKDDFSPEQFIEEINTALKDAVVAHQKEYSLRMSIGYFKHTPEIKNIAEFISAADKYLYRQKSERSLKRAIKETVDNSFKK